MNTSRRQFLDAAAAATLLTGCTTAQASVVRGACHHDCPDACAWLVTRENGKLVKLDGDPRHPFTRGELCSKMDHYLDDVVRSPERLLYPLRRVGAKGEGRFERVSWDQALDAVASRLQTIIAESGPEAILPYSFAGTECIVQGGSLDRRFFARTGLDPLPTYEPVRQTGGELYPLRLLTSKASRYFLNSSHAGVAGSIQAEGRPLLRMHSDDADRRGIRDGEMVRVFNQRGSMLVRVKVTNSLRAGIVAMSHGWWASMMPGQSSPNALTSDGLTDLGGGDFHDSWVQVSSSRPAA